MALLALAFGGIARATTGGPTGRNYFINSDIAPFEVNNSSAGAATIAAPGAGLYNCLSKVVTTSTGTYTFRILDNATTGYQLTGITGSVVLEWPLDDAYCTATANTPMTVKASTTTGAGQDIMYKGFVRQ